MSEGCSTLKPSLLLEPGDVAELLGVSAQRVRQLADEGKLPPAAVTPRGLRLFDRAAVERLAADRGRAPTGEPAKVEREGPPPSRQPMRCDSCGSEYLSARRPFACNAPECDGTVRA